MVMFICEEVVSCITNCVENDKPEWDAVPFRPRTPTGKSYIGLVGFLTDERMIRHIGHLLSLLRLSSKLMPLGYMR
jgi:hypothetical protein